MQQLILSDSLLRVIHRGLAGAPIVDAMSRSVLEILPSVQERAPAVLELACKELVAVSKALRALCGSDQYGVDEVNQLPSSCDVIKQLLNQTPFWREKDKQLRESAVARAMFGPEVKAAAAKLEGETMTLEEFLALGKRVVVWQEGLPTGDIHAGGINARKVSLEWSGGEACCCGCIHTLVGVLSYFPLLAPTHYKRRLWGETQRDTHTHKHARTHARTHTLHMKLGVFQSALEGFRAGYERPSWPRRVVLRSCFLSCRTNCVFVFIPGLRV